MHWLEEIKRIHVSTYWLEEMLFTWIQGLLSRINIFSKLWLPTVRTLGYTLRQDRNGGYESGKAQSLRTSLLTKLPQVRDPADFLLLATLNLELYDKNYREQEVLIYENWFLGTNIIPNGPINHFNHMYYSCLHLFDSDGDRGPTVEESAILNFPKLW